MPVRFRMGGDGRLPLGFRFRPTDEELLTHYLAPKAADAGFAPAAVREVDFYKAEPWDLLPAGGDGGEGGGSYFFCRRSVKFPSGLRTNRATRAGYWKSTGKDKVVLRQHGGGGTDSGRGEPLGLKKTLVFYRGRAPTGEKTNWVMHEYRLPSFDGCNGGKMMTAVGAEASNPEHANFFSDALAIAPADRHHGTEGHAAQGVLALQLNHEELLMNYSVSDYASAAAPASELLQQATLLRDDELRSDSDLLPQLLDYEGFPFLQDF
ncbi:hypothetical protein C2845_PM03G34330 [Panicum miliaceum]|uniref:NAC domain-containing protein n=1 Tax=Panicum miliaceum TaxID=4540 RepID=A0A3L6T819_PANMI|nr:hypothetical protein C2845_PM03G34330 [Panicum miliaceum]